MWKNDNFFIGLLTAFLLTAVTAVLIFFTAPAIYGLFTDIAPENKVLLLAFVPAILLMRWYFQKFKFEKAGMGALLMVFIFIVLYYIFIESNPVRVFPY